MICRKETITYKAKPQIYDINKYKLVVSSPELSSTQKLDFVLIGNFLNILNVYLSSSNSTLFEQPLTFYDPFSGIEKLSAKNIPFFAIKLSSFSFSEKFLMLEFPEIPKAEGYVDVIVENEAGYSKLSVETIVKTITSCENVPSYQKPCISGIQIKFPTGIFFETPPLDVTFNTTIFTDTDNDTYSDADEAIAGTDPNDPNSFPISLFNVFNNI